jgi:hypothetical protein
MPGRKPAEAVQTFLEPLQLALSCVAHGKVTTRKGGYSPPVDAQQQWSLNDGDAATLKANRDFTGVKLPGTLEFYAHMWWRVIRDERPGFGPYRVTTIGYDYSLVCGEEGQTEVWAMHWHPDSASEEVRPHVHLGDMLLTPQSPICRSSHLLTGRMTFENAIRWLIEFGVQPIHENWEQRLREAEGPHLANRSWSSDPRAEISDILQ